MISTVKDERWKRLTQTYKMFQEKAFKQLFFVQKTSYQTSNIVGSG